jgi:hypothetical protein
MEKRKKIGFIILFITCFCLICIFLSAVFFKNPGNLEKKIAQYIYSDQTEKAVSEINILLFFHPKNLYGIRMKDLLTSNSIRYP